jgi:hypothetical protein
MGLRLDEIPLMRMDTSRKSVKQEECQKVLGKIRIGSPRVPAPGRFL